MKIHQVQHLPLGSHIRLPEHMFRARYQSCSLPISDFFLRATFIGLRARDQIAVLGWAKAAKAFPQNVTASQIHNYPDFVYLNKAAELYPFCWSIYGDTFCVLDELQPDQKCQACQIPLPHFEKMDRPLCNSCRFLLEFD